MDIHGHFVFGLDNDTTDVFESTLASINNLGLTIAEFHIMTPFPGTPLFDRLDREGRIVTKDWSRYMMSMVNFKPKLMSEEELVNGVQSIKKRFYSFKNFSQTIHEREDMNLWLMTGMIATHFISKVQLGYSDL